MNQSPTYSVRFFIRASRGREELTTLRVMVWLTAQKKYVYVSTDIKITPNQFSAFSSDGTPTSRALPFVAEGVKTWRIAVNRVVGAIIESGHFDRLTSEYVSQQSKQMVERIRNGENDSTPLDVKTCEGCVFRGLSCRAPWIFDAEAERAAHYAEVNNICRNRTLIAAIVGDTPYFLFQPNPKVDGVLMCDERLNAAATETWNAKKGGNK